MNREQYIQYRNANSIDPLYFYYTEHCKENCLDSHTFLRFFTLWPMGNEVFQKLLMMYDIKYEVMKIENLKTGQIIKYL